MVANGVEGIAVAPGTACDLIGLGGELFIENAIAQMLRRIDIRRAVRNPHNQIGLGSYYTAGLHHSPLAIPSRPRVP